MTGPAARPRLRKTHNGIVGADGADDPDNGAEKADEWGGKGVAAGRVEANINLQGGAKGVPDWEAKSVLQNLAQRGPDSDARSVLQNLALL